jgi:hypothetical protein
MGVVGVGGWTCKLAISLLTLAGRVDCSSAVRGRRLAEKRVRFSGKSTVPTLAARFRLVASSDTSCFRFEVEDEPREFEGKWSDEADA